MPRTEADVRAEADARIAAGDRGVYYSDTTVSGTTWLTDCLWHAGLEETLESHMPAINYYGNPWVSESGDWAVAGALSTEPWGARPTGSYSDAMATIDLQESNISLEAYLQTYSLAKVYERHHGWVLRYADSSNYILLYFNRGANLDTGQWTLEVIESGDIVQTVLGDTNSAFNNWLFRIYLNGQSIMCDKYINGITWVTVIDAQIAQHTTNTKHGFYYNASGYDENDRWPIFDARDETYTFFRNQFL